MIITRPNVKVHIIYQSNQQTNQTNQQEQTHAHTHTHTYTQTKLYEKNYFSIWPENWSHMAYDTLIYHLCHCVAVVIVVIVSRLSFLHRETNEKCAHATYHTIRSTSSAIHRPHRPCSRFDATPI